MANETTVVLGLGIVSGLLAWYSFELKNDPSEMTRKMSVFLWFLSLFFMDLVVFASLLIAQNSGLTYLQTGVMSTALTIVTWLSVILVFVFLFGTFLSILDGMKEWWKSYRKGRSRE